MFILIEIPEELRNETVEKAFICLNLEKISGYNYQEETTGVKTLYIWVGQTEPIQIPGKLASALFKMLNDRFDAVKYQLDDNKDYLV